MNNKHHVTVLEIDATAIKHNLNFFKQQLKPTTKLMAVVKAFGYGSDGVEIAKIIQDEVAYFAVAYTDEGIALRKAGIKTPILVLHPQIPNLTVLTKYQLEPNLYNHNILQAFLKQADTVPLMNYPIHIKFNTGLNRLGFWHNDIPAVLAEIKKSNHVRIQSIFSHLTASEDPEEQEFTVGQINNFAYIVKQFYEHLDYEPMIHILNTSGVINFTAAQFDMVRVGIGLFGFGNHPEITAQLKNTHNLKSIISQIHLIQPGETVGYNRSFVAKRPTKSATMPIGHADGISRKLGNKNGVVIINNQQAYIIGNVCMDMIMVDVTDIECNEGDEVIIFNHQQHIEFMAYKTDTIPYEILTAIGQRIQRRIKS